MKSPSKKSNTQMHMMAARLYNKGLEQAQGRCLTGAKESLLSCIALEKDYIDARNLLGLIYWETGQVGQALKQWVISSSYQKEDNIATKYLELTDKNQYKLSKYNEAISFYNKALEYFKKDINDIATINLRKSISNNPNYTEAKTLLGLYHISVEDEAKARKNLQDVLGIDKDNSRANKYMQSLSADAVSTKSNQPNKKKVTSKASKPVVVAKGMQSNSFKGNILAFIVGAVCMFGIYAVLVVPAKTSNLKAEIKETEEKQENIETELTASADEKDQKIENLSKENIEMEEKLSALEEDQLYQKQITKLDKAKELSAAAEWIESAAEIEQIDTEYLDDIEEYTELKDDVYVKAGERLYNQGYAEYQRRNLDEALELLEKSYKYAKEEYYSDNALFTIGRVHEDQENLDQAEQYYNTVIKDYEGTDGAYNAERRLPLED